MNIFYVTFGMGTIFRGYYVAFEALNIEIVKAFMNRRVKTPFSAIYEGILPSACRPLQPTPEVLCYQRAEDIR